MRISKKIGLSFFITFFLVIILGAISIYTLRNIYHGLNIVFAKDLPTSNINYQIAFLIETLPSDLANFLITGNENFKIAYENSLKELKRDISNLERFTSKSKEEEKAYLEQVQWLVEEVDGLGKEVFEKYIKKKNFLDNVRLIESDFMKKLDGLLDFEEKRIQTEKDFLLIQMQHLPASQLIMDVHLKFLKIFEEINRYQDISGLEVVASKITDLEKALRNYKNYYGYAFSENEQNLTNELITLIGKIRDTVGLLIDTEKELVNNLTLFMSKEKELMSTLDEIINARKGVISSRLGVGMALTEDIPSIHAILDLEKDIIESWQINRGYLLNGNPDEKSAYYQLREKIERGLKDYARHARLRGTERFLDEIIENDKALSKAIDSNMEIFEKRQSAIAELISVRTRLETKLDNLLADKEMLVKETKDQDLVLNTLLPARWTLMRLKSEIFSASRSILYYLNDQNPRYKDLYTGMYFDMKKNLSRYKNFSFSDREKSIIDEVEIDLDRFNTLALSAVEACDRIIKGTGWELIKLEDALKESLDKAIDVETDRINKNRDDLMNRIRFINILIFLIIGIVAFLMVFVIFYTTGSITEPIHKLYTGAEIIGKGNLDYRLDIKTGDEIEELASGFNKMAGELKELYTNLENKVKERTLQLAQANEALGRINKELDDFTYIVSHDLKEPLRGIKAFTKLLMEEHADRLNEEAREYLKVISESSTRMTRLIEDLLNLSRIGRIKNIESGIDIDEVLSDVKKNLAYSLEEKGADLKLIGPFPKITCDRIRITEVFTNLISNAIKYSKKDVPPVVEVGCRDDGDFYEFYVKDNGIGIEEKYYDKVFQIFQRLHAKDEYEGTGAGLTIVKKIIESHNGKIWLESVPGEGTTFYFTLPKRYG